MKKIIILFVLVLSPGMAQAAILNIQEVTSPKGIKAWLVEDHTIPVISMEYAFKGAGAVNDPKDKQGLARLLSNTMDEGAGDLTSTQFQGRLVDKSINLTFNASRDDFGGGLSTLSKNRDEAFDLLALALHKPRFDKDAVARMIEANLSRIRNDMTDPEWMVARLSNASLYGDHPYSMNSGGTLSSLPKITSEDLRTKAKSDLTRDRLIVSVAGDITPDELGTLLDKTFADLPEKGNAPQVSDVSLPAKGETTLYSLNIPQTLIIATLPGMRMDDPDYQTATVMNFIFGSSGFGSRLTEIIREQNGLTYGIYTDMSMMDHAALFTLSTSTKNETAARLMDLTRKEFDRMKTGDVTKEEIADAKSYLVGSTALSLTSTEQIAGMMLAFQRYNLPKNYLDIRAAAIEKVTSADIKRVAARLFDMSRLSVAMVGKPDGIAPTKTITELPNVK